MSQTVNAVRLQVFGIQLELAGKMLATPYMPSLLKAVRVLGVLWTSHQFSDCCQQKRTPA